MNARNTAHGLQRRASRARRILQLVNSGAPDQGRLSYLRSVVFGEGAYVDEYRMANGLEVLLLQDPSAPVVAFHAWFRVGSRHETPGKTGLAHLFEHLMFNEIEGLPPGAFDSKMEAAGADNNASTWLDFTQYQEAFPKRHLAMVIELEARRMRSLVVRQPQLDCEKDVVKNERRLRVEDDVEGVAEELLYKTAFTQHPYGWPTIGWMQDIEGFTLDDTGSFYDQYYAPNNASLILVGDLDERRALNLVSEHYGTMAPSQLPLERTSPEPPQTAERHAQVELTTSTFKLLIGYAAPALGDADHVIATLLVESLTGGNASRLHRGLVRDRQVASEVAGFVGPHLHPGLIEFSIAVRPGVSAEEALAAFDVEVQTLLNNAPTDDELTRAKNRIELSLRNGLQTADGKAAIIGFFQCLLRRPAGALERLEQLTLVNRADVLRVARRYLQVRARSVVTVVPRLSAEGPTSARGSE